jgi:hypothetical protein
MRNFILKMVVLWYVAVCIPVDTWLAASMRMEALSSSKTEVSIYWTT